VLSEIGPVDIEVPRDREGSFAPTIVGKRQRRLDGVDEIVLSLSARGLTTGEIAAHFAEVYGARVSRDTITPDHRQGHRGDDRVAQPAPRPRLNSIDGRERSGRRRSDASWRTKPDASPGQEAVLRAHP
jgi:hypothetical protein